MLSLADYYLHSPQFLSLRGRTQKDYEYVISKVMATPIRHGKNMGELKVDRVTVSDCKTAYQQWLARGVRTANMSATLSSLLFNLAEEFELISRNPMRSIKKLQTQPRKVMWTADQVRLFCDTTRRIQVEKYRSYSSDGIHICSEDRGYAFTQVG